MKLRKLSRPGMLSFMLQRICTWHPLRFQSAKLLARLRPRRQLTSESGAASDLVQDLERDGYSLLPQFVDAATVQRIRKHLEGAFLSERFAPRRSGFTLDEVPDNVHVAEYAVEHLIKSQDIVALTHNPLLLDVATLYLGCKPTISNFSVWWSIPADGTAQEAENYHRDVDDWRFVKFFLYLSDVSATAGPHRFVKGSHKSSRFLVTGRRFTDAAVEAAFGKENCLSMLGNAGDAFLEDTFGLHKGQPPFGSRRLVLQIQYSINPIAVYDYEPRPIDKIPELFDEYIARLYMTERN